MLTRSLCPLVLGYVSDFCKLGMEGLICLHPYFPLIHLLTVWAKLRKGGS